MNFIPDIVKHTQNKVSFCACMYMCACVPC